MASLSKPIPIKNRYGVWGDFGKSDGGMDSGKRRIMQILKFQIETSQWTEGAYWDDSGECYVENRHLWLADGFNQLPYSEDALLDMADGDPIGDVRYASKTPVVEWYSDIVDVDGEIWYVFRETAKICDVCEKRISEDDDDYHDYHEPSCPRCQDFDGESDCEGCDCSGVAHAECCPECNDVKVAR